MNLTAKISSDVRHSEVSPRILCRVTSFVYAFPALRSFQRTSPLKQISRKITSHAFVATDVWLPINIENDKPVLKWQDGRNLNVFLFYCP